MRHKLILAAVLLAASGSAAATCYGTSTMRTCTDANGNSYTTTKIGSSSYTNGYNANTGASWNQSTQRIGNSSYTNGSNAQGNSWNSSTQRIGNSSYTYGSDSQGNTYSGQTRSSNGTTTYSGSNSQGQIYNKTCNQYGCY